MQPKDISEMNLQVMAMSRNGVWDWLTINDDLKEGALKECIEKRLPYRLTPAISTTEEKGESEIEFGEWPTAIEAEQYIYNKGHEDGYNYARTQPDTELIKFVLRYIGMNKQEVDQSTAAITEAWGKEKGK